MGARAWGVGNGGGVAFLVVLLVLILFLFRGFACGTTRLVLVSRQGFPQFTFLFLFYDCEYSPYILFFVCRSDRS